MSFEFLKRLIKSSDDETECNTPIADTFPPLTEETVKEMEEEDIEIVAGENMFETRYLTWINYLYDYKDQLIDHNRVEFEQKIKIRKFLDWSYLPIDRYNFKFVEDFSYALLNLADNIFMSDTCVIESKEGSFKCIYDNATKSLKVIYNYKNTQILFDFYKIPSRINSALDAIDPETSSLLEKYIDGKNINDDESYLYISFITGNNKAREITIPNNGSDVFLDSKDKFILDSIFMRTYRYIKSSYRLMLLRIAQIYFDLSLENLIDPQVTNIKEIIL